MMGKNPRDTTSRLRFPWFRVGLTLLLLAWCLASMWVSAIYTIPVTDYGTLGDGSDQGFEMVRGFGLAYGCVVMQTRHRVRDVGWQVQRENPHFRLWMLRENVEGYWTITTSGVSLLLPILGLAATTIPYWRRQLRKAGDK